MDISKKYSVNAKHNTFKENINPHITFSFFSRKRRALRRKEMAKEFSLPTLH